MNMVMGVVENKPDGYLVKPINKSVLQVRLERVVARKTIVKGIESALKAYRRAIQMAENSCFARPDDQAGVVESITQAKGPAAGLKTLGEFTKRAGWRFEGKQHWRLANEYLGRAIRISLTGEKVLRLRQQFQSQLNQGPKSVASALASVG